MAACRLRCVIAAAPAFTKKGVGGGRASRFRKKFPNFQGKVLTGSACFDHNGDPHHAPPRSTQRIGSVIFRIHEGQKDEKAS
jgi:hypothetical protein